MILWWKVQHPCQQRKFEYVCNTDFSEVPLTPKIKYLLLYKILGSHSSEDVDGDHLGCDTV
jgi:hypothetical protein